MIAGIIQARVSSTRLPGKVLKEVLGKPILAHMVERVLRAAKIDRIVIATSEDKTDDPIAGIANKLGIDCYRGSLEDVLARYYHAAVSANCAHVVRLTGDCPLIDPVIIDEVITFYIDGGYDYASNVVEPTWPDGEDVEVMSFASLEKSFNEAKLPSHREHVTQYILSNRDRFRIGSLKRGEDISSMRWTLDEQADLEFVTRVYRELYPGNPSFGLGDVLGLLRKKPELAEINAGIGRNEGLAKSKNADKFDLKTGID
ncbi:MAG: glycosyltransferase family protein [Nitrospinota bacterium]|nr:glycosyltransferase family protein [Nitrospinota bacterium]